MRSLEHFWNSVSATTEYISPARKYPAGGLMFLNNNDPATKWLGPSNNVNFFKMPQIRTVYLTLNENLTGQVNVKIKGIGAVLPSSSDNYPLCSEIEETITIETSGKYESVNIYDAIHSIEILDNLDSGDVNAPATLAAGLGSKGYMPYITADYNSSSPMHYAFQVETFEESELFTHQGFVNARNPVTYVSYPPIGLYNPTSIPGWAMYTARSTDILISSLDNYTADATEDLVGALAPISILYVYINDPAVDGDEAPLPQTGKAYITFLQQGLKA